MVPEELGVASVSAVGAPSIDATLVVTVVVTLIVVAMIAFVTFLAFGPSVSSQFGEPSDHAIGSGVEHTGEADRGSGRDVADATDRDATETFDRE